MVPHGSHWPHRAIEHLKCGWSKWKTAVSVNILQISKYIFKKDHLINNFHISYMVKQ